MAWRGTYMHTYPRTDIRMYMQYAPRSRFSPFNFRFLVELEIARDSFRRSFVRLVEYEIEWETYYVCTYVPGER